MPRLRANGIELEYVRSARAGSVPLLMIHGVGAQLIRWPPGLIDRLEAAGFDAIRYDSRDIGLSTHMDDAPVPDLADVARVTARGEVPDLPYTLSDLARDAVGLLDGLDLRQAHVLGVSLGGMVAQVLAIEHPERVRSLAIFMSTSGSPDLPPPAASATTALAARPPDPRDDMEGFLAHSVALNRALGSPAYPVGGEILRALAREAASRSYNPNGVARQLAASRGAVDRRDALRGIAAATLVVHGADDPLIAPSASADIARRIARAWLLIVDGMGHDLPEPLFDLFASTVAANTRRA